MQGAAVAGLRVFEEDLLVLAHKNKIYKSDSTNECKQIIRVFRLLRKRTSKATTALADQVSFAARIR